MTMERITIRLPHTLLEDVDGYAAWKNLTRAAAIRLLLTNHFEQDRGGDDA